MGEDQQTRYQRMAPGGGPVNRRKFIAGAAAAAGAVLGGVGMAFHYARRKIGRGEAVPAAPPTEPARPETSAQPPSSEPTPATGMKYRTLGRTGFKVSEISFGAIAVQDTGVAVLHRLADAGVNYIDTADCYGNGRSEEVLKEFLKTRREEVFVATKWHTDGVNTTKQALLQSFQTSRDRMGIDRIDLIQIHDASNVTQVRCPRVREAFEELKAQGQVRFLGVTTHSNQDTVVNEAVRLGYFDTVLVGYNFMSPEAHTRALANAKAHNVGVVIMKAVAPNAQQMSQRFGSPPSLYQAALKWVLEHDSVSTIIVTMRNFEHVRENLGAVGPAMTSAEREQLGRYAQAIASDFCRMCGQCTGACPRGVAVADILRYDMYYRGYQERGPAQAQYARLGPARSAASCDGCGECIPACPFGLDVVEKLRQAHAVLA